MFLNTFYTSALAEKTSSMFTNSSFQQIGISSQANSYIQASKSSRQLGVKGDFIEISGQEDFLTCHASYNVVSLCFLQRCFPVSLYNNSCFLQSQVIRFQRDTEQTAWNPVCLIYVSSPIKSNWTTRINKAHDNRTTLSKWVCLSSKQLLDVYSLMSMWF